MLQIPIRRLPRTGIVQTSLVSRVSRSTTRMSSTNAFPSYFITPTQLHSALETSPSSLVPVSAPWYLPNDSQKRTGHASFQASHIAGSRFFDLDAIADTSSPYPHMLPSAAVFSTHMSRLGIRSSDTIVVYDSPDLGLFSAPRVAWTFRMFGHEGPVHVLNNYKLWVEQGLPTVEREQERFEETGYRAKEPRWEMVAGFEEVRALGEKMRDGDQAGGVQILDARSRGRWQGKDPEPRPGLSSGRIPGSLSVPFSDVIDAKTKTMKGREELRALFEERGIKGDHPIVASCGTGVTAAVVEAALEEAGLAGGKRKVYDGSWTEWAMRVGKEEGLIEKDP